MKLHCSPPPLSPSKSLDLQKWHVFTYDQSDFLYKGTKKHLSVSCIFCRLRTENWSTKKKNARELVLIKTKSSLRIPSDLDKLLPIIFYVATANPLTLMSHSTFVSCSPTMKPSHCYLCLQLFPNLCNGKNYTFCNVFGSVLGSN